MVKELEILIVIIAILFSALLLYTIFHKGSNAKNLKILTSVGGCLSVIIIGILTIIIVLIIGIGQCSISINH